MDEIWKRYGQNIDVVFWHAPDVDMNTVQTSISIGGTAFQDGNIRTAINPANNAQIKATVVTVPIDVKKGEDIVIESVFSYIVKDTSA